ncbi:hypothetical protein [Verrucomicrobium sp. BvORR106]|uniref:hypothetical protein n=1 Tax=Verrucomicrobium sp. BvORR106 TaxID=1403819 RepID=UPI00068AC83D|nr:hypothetical protein [Verrucomicrobium sp. BvORR106]
MISLSHPPYTVQLREGFPVVATSTSAEPGLLLLDEAGAAPVSCHRIEVLEADRKLAQLQLQAGKGETGVHEHSALIADEILFIACGAYVTALQLPGLDQLWSSQVDDQTCFGVYHHPIHHCLITHGEQAITRINFDGSMVWQAEGDGVWTGPLELEAQTIAVTDDSGRRYELDITTGVASQRVPA